MSFLTELLIEVAKKDLDTNRLLPDTLYILRGFGVFRIEVGEGQSGKALVNTLRSASNNDKEAFRDAHIKCPINNRMCNASTTLKFGTTRMGTEDETTCVMSDFASVPTTVLEDWFLDDEKWKEDRWPLQRSMVLQRRLLIRLTSLARCTAGVAAKKGSKHYASSLEFVKIRPICPPWNS